MNVRTDIFFHPDSLGDISDFISVATEGGNFKIPLVARRNPPQLNIPSTIDIGKDKSPKELQILIAQMESKLESLSAERDIILSKTKAVDEAIKTKHHQLQQAMDDLFIFHLFIDFKKMNRQKFMSHINKQTEVLRS